MFIAVLFIVAKKEKQLKCPSTDKWMNKMWYSHAIKHYLVMKKNKVLIYAPTWLKFENIMLSERNQS